MHCKITKLYITRERPIHYKEGDYVLQENQHQLHFFIWKDDIKRITSNDIEKTINTLHQSFITLTLKKEYIENYIAKHKA